MNDAKLKRIGQNVACLWGGSLIKVECVKIGYKFTIAENGDIFTTTIKMEDIAKYDY